MNRFIAGLIITFCSFVVFACPTALPTDDPNFCSSFKTAASCHCSESGIPGGMCQSMDRIYSLMLARYGSVDNACNAQRHTDPQTCKDNWRCYREGGTDSRGRVCSSTARSCQ